MLKRIERNLTLIVGIFFLVLAILPFLAPIFAHLGLHFLADPIYWLYQWLCHQRPWRSYHLFDYQVADCARNNFIYAGLASAALFTHFKKTSPLKGKTALILAILSIVPLGLDGVIQMIAEISASSSNSIPFYESTNLIRSIVGTILGTGVGLSIFPFLNTSVSGKSSIKEILKLFGLIFAMNLIAIPIIVLAWNVTSIKYKPSSPIIDHEQRFPGYNYEITSRAGHSTIKPIVDEPVDKYIQRAKKYNKQELLDEYYQKQNGN